MTTYSINKSNWEVESTETTPIDVKTVAINGRTYIPIRSALEAFGDKVKWDAKNYLVDITTQYVMFDSNNAVTDTDKVSVKEEHLFYADKSREEIIAKYGSTEIDGVKFHFDDEGRCNRIVYEPYALFRNYKGLFTKKDMENIFAQHVEVDVLEAPAKLPAKYQFKFLATDNIFTVRVDCDLNGRLSDKSSITFSFNRHIGYHDVYSLFYSIPDVLIRHVGIEEFDSWVKDKYGTGYMNMKYLLQSFNIGKAEFEEVIGIYYGEIYDTDVIYLDENIFNIDKKIIDAIDAVTT